MDNPRPEKVAVVDDVRERLRQADAVIVTEYRGLKVKDLAALRRSLAPLGAEYRVFKNTLVRIAAKRRPGRFRQASHRADGPRIRRWGCRRRHQGPARLLPGQPPDADQGRPARHLRPWAGSDCGPGRPPLAGGPAGPPGWCPGCADAKPCRLVGRRTPQLRLRARGARGTSAPPERTDHAPPTGRTTPTHRPATNDPGAQQRCQPQVTRTRSSRRSPK